MTAIQKDARAAILLTASLVSSLIMLDSNIVAVALPAIGRSFGAMFADIQWVISAYVLTYASLLMGSGNFADLYGRRLSMMIGLVIFGFGSIGCGLAPSAALLNLARAGQGIGGAFLLTASLAVISNAFTGEERSHAFAVWGAALGMALAIGPVVGGAITTLLGWRWVFWINVPLVAALLLMTMSCVSESRDPSARRIDPVGIVTFSPGLALLIWALIDGNDAGWASFDILLRLAGSFVFLGGFAMAELYQSEPMVDPSLFRSRAFLGAVTAMIGYGASAQVMVFFLPLFLQVAYGYAPLKAGLAMLPFALPMVMAPHITAKLAGAYSSRAILVFGLGITIVGNLLFSLIAREGGGYTLFVISMLVAGLGAGILNGQTVKAVGAAVPPERAGMASGLASTTRFIGILVAVAGFGATLALVTKHEFLPAAMGAGLNKATAVTLAGRVSSGGLASALDSLPGDRQAALRQAATHAFMGGFSVLSLIAAAVAGFAAILAFSLTGHDVTPTAGPCKTMDCRHPL